MQMVPCVCLVGDAVRRVGGAAWVGVGMAGEDMGAEERDPGSLSMPTTTAWMDGKSVDGCVIEGQCVPLVSLLGLSSLRWRTGMLNKQTMYELK